MEIPRHGRVIVPTLLFAGRRSFLYVCGGDRGSPGQCACSRRRCDMLGAMAAKRPSRAMLLLTILAAPVALAFETLLRALLFPPEFESVREFLRPMLTPVAWALGGMAAIASLAGLALQRSMAAKRVRRLPSTADDEARYGAVLGVFMITTAVPQIPAVLSTFAFMFGASFVPVAVGIGLCSAGVIAQAVRVGPLARSLR